MLTQRLVQYSTRQCLLPHRLASSKQLLPASITASNVCLQRRAIAFQPSSSPAQTTPAKPSDAYTILAAQRLKRPVAPHLTIYRPQLTWYLSALNRITGSVLSGGIYVFGAAYLVSPLFGWHLESHHLAEMFGSLGPVTKYLLKFGVAVPFTFHSWNGIRHLVWDTGREFSNKSVIRTGWAVVGLTVVSSAALAYM